MVHFEKDYKKYSIIIPGVNRIHGRNVRKFERNEPQYIVKFFLNKLLGRELADQIKVRVYIRKMQNQYGNCWSYEKSPREYTITISSALTRTESIRILGHETIHVMQHATGKMKNLWGRQNKGKVVWKNKTLDVIDRGKAHFDQPWEKEAYDRQETLLNCYLNHTKKS